VAQVLVDADQLEDLCSLVDDILSRATEDRVLDIAVIRGVPLPTMAAARGALAEIRCHSTVAG
jgi:hypothetical protein